MICLKIAFFEAKILLCIIKYVIFIICLNYYLLHVFNFFDVNAKPSHHLVHLPRVNSSRYHLYNPPVHWVLRSIYSI